MRRGSTRAPTCKERKTCGPSLISNTDLVAVGSVSTNRRAGDLAHFPAQCEAVYGPEMTLHALHTEPQRGTKRWRRCGPSEACDLSPRAGERSGKLAGSGSRVREPVGLKLLAQRCLEDFSGRGMRNAVDEHDVVGHPPLGDLAIHELQDVLPRGALALLELHDQQRTLVPFRMIDPDDGRFRDSGMPHRQIFQVDRRNPLTAGLDHILGTVRDPHVSVAVDGGDVAGVEIAFLIEDVAVDTEI